MANGRRAAVLGALVLALPALALVAKLPSHLKILSVLNDAAHAPVFGALAIVWLLLLNQSVASRSWQRYAGAFLLAVVMGGCIELIQPALGRGAELRDLLNDALGAVAGLATYRAFGSRQWHWLWIAVAALVPVAWPVANASIAYSSRASEFPTLVGDDTRADRYFIRTHGVEVMATLLPAKWARTDDPRSFRLRIAGSRWPGVTYSEPQPDWRGYSRLLLDLTNPEVRPLTLTLRVHDRSHNNRRDDRFNQTFTIASSSRSVWSVPLAEIEEAPLDRDLDLSGIAGVILFSDGNLGDLGREYYLTRIWLE